MTKVSIIMNCLNGETYLKEAIDSIYAQSYKDWEIIFIDNGSTDSSAEIVKMYDSRLRYYRTEYTIPLYAARNYGLQYISGSYVAFLDTDDIWLPNKLEKQIQIMHQNPEIYLICTNIYRKNQLLGRISPYTSGPSHYLNFEKTLDKYFITLSTAMIRINDKSTNDIKFEPSLNLTGDYELFMRLIYKYKSYFINEPLVTYRVHEKNLSSKLVNDWPKELAETHNRLTHDLSLSAFHQKLMDIRYAKTCGLVYLANKDFKKARSVTKKYCLKNAKLLIIFLSTFNKKLALWLLKIRGFN